MTNFTFSHAVADFLAGVNQSYPNLVFIYKVNRLRMDATPEFPHGIPSVFAEPALVADCGPVAGLPNQPHVSDY